MKIKEDTMPLTIENLKFMTLVLILCTISSIVFNFMSYDHMQTPTANIICNELRNLNQEYTGKNKLEAEVFEHS